MLDRFSIKLLKTPLEHSATFLHQRKVTANQATIFGFCVGVLSLPALVLQQYDIALILIILNRVCDGLDGALARIQGVTDAGGFLDISLDFLFYSLVPFGFVLADPQQNAIAGAFLIFAFIGTGTSFLAFAVMAGKRGIQSPVYKNKSLYYMTGLTEGTETIACFIFFCLLPHYFAEIAYLFGFLCWITTANRIWAGFNTLSSVQDKTVNEENQVV